MNAKEGNGWSEWQNFVLIEMKRLSANVDKLNDTVQDHREQTAGEIATLKVKAGVWAGFGGMIPVILFAAWYLIKTWSIGG